MSDAMYRFKGGPFDGRTLPAKGLFFKIPCRDFMATPRGKESYVAHTVAVYEVCGDRNNMYWYEFRREELIYDGYRATQVKP